jgi:hypothetical protein
VRKIFVFALSVLILFVLNFSFSKAYAEAPCAPGKLINGKCTAVDTAIGIISTDPPEFVKNIFTIVLGLAGGIALLMIIIAGYKFMTSAGNPEALKGATEQLTSAIVGLLFIILSFVILQIIGVDILRIPGFG